VNEYCIFRIGYSWYRAKQWQEARTRYPHLEKTAPKWMTSVLWMGRMYDVEIDRFSFLVMWFGQVVMRWPARSLREFFNLRHV